jgi:hypothetical protein
LIRYLKPREKRNFRTIISGLVSFPRILDINALRSFKVKTSVVNIAKFSYTILDDTISGTEIIKTEMKEKYGAQCRRVVILTR